MLTARMNVQTWVELIHWYRPSYPHVLDFIRNESFGFFPTESIAHKEAADRKLGDFQGHALADEKFANGNAQEGYSFKRCRVVLWEGRKTYGRLISVSDTFVRLQKGRLHEIRAKKRSRSRKR
ncbi:MAG TPA: hypothetical protein VJC12_03570 [Candidatus Paceibacterota bacterium]